MSVRRHVPAGKNLNKTINPIFDLVCIGSFISKDFHLNLRHYPLITLSESFRHMSVKSDNRYNKVSVKDRLSAHCLIRVLVSND